MFIPLSTLAVIMWWAWHHDRAVDRALDNALALAHAKDDDDDSDDYDYSDRAGWQPPSAYVAPEEYETVHISPWPTLEGWYEAY